MFGNSETAATAGGAAAAAGAAAVDAEDEFQREMMNEAKAAGMGLDASRWAMRAESQVVREILSKATRTDSSERAGSKAAGVDQQPRDLRAFSIDSRENSLTEFRLNQSNIGEMQ